MFADKKIFLTLILFLLAICLCACSEMTKTEDALPDYIDFDQLAEGYGVENAVHDDCVVFADSKLISGEDVWKAFMTNVEKKGLGVPIESVIKISICIYRKVTKAKHTVFHGNRMHYDFPAVCLHTIIYCSNRQSGTVQLFLPGVESCGGKNPNVKACAAAKIR